MKGRISSRGTCYLQSSSFRMESLQKSEISLVETPNEAGVRTTGARK